MGKPHRHVEFYQANGIPYKLSYTSTSARLVTDQLRIFFSEDSRRVTKREFILRNQLKKIINDRVDVVLRNPAKAQYIKMAPSIDSLNIREDDLIVAENVYEIDLNQAYYYAAYQLGYISEEFFQKTLDLPKHIRLRLLGSIATRTHIEESDGEEIWQYTKQDEKMRDIWHNIVCHVDRVMDEMAEALGQRFLFYWVDGIYFSSFGDQDIPARVVEQIAEKNNFEVKKKKLQKIEIRRINRYLVAHVYTDESTEPKPFTYAYKNGTVPVPRNINSKC